MACPTNAKEFIKQVGRGVKLSSKDTKQLVEVYNQLKAVKESPITPKKFDESLNQKLVAILKKLYPEIKLEYTEDEIQPVDIDDSAVMSQVMGNEYKTLEKIVDTDNLRQDFKDIRILRKYGNSSNKRLVKELTLVPGKFNELGYVKQGAKLVTKEGLEISYNPIDYTASGSERKLKTSFDSFSEHELNTLNTYILEKAEEKKRNIDNIKEYIKTKSWRENQKRDVEVPSHIQELAEEILDVAFPSYKYLAKDPDAMPYIANLANYYAKTKDEYYYSLKPELVSWMARNNTNAWSKEDGIVYVEGKLGQVSFHVFEEEDKIARMYGDSPFNKEWSGIGTQMVAESIMNDYIDMYGDTTKETATEKELRDERYQTFFDKNPNAKKVYQTMLQKQDGKIKGQANIEAKTVLINSLLQSQDTLPHEYAHHYIAWFRDTPIVQEAIKKWSNKPYKGKIILANAGTGKSVASKNLDYVIDGDLLLVEAVNKIIKREKSGDFIDDVSALNDVWVSWGKEDKSREKEYTKLRNEVYEIQAELAKKAANAGNTVLVASPRKPILDVVDIVMYQDNVDTLLTSRTSKDRINPLNMTREETIAKNKKFLEATKGKDIIYLKKNEFVLDKLVQDGEEVLVQAIGEQVVKQEGEAWGWWKKFGNWLHKLFDGFTKEDKESIKNLLTDAFLVRANLDGISRLNNYTNQIKKFSNTPAIKYLLKEYGSVKNLNKALIDSNDSTDRQDDIFVSTSSLKNRFLNTAAKLLAIEDGRSLSYEYKNLITDIKATNKFIEKVKPIKDDLDNIRTKGIKYKLIENPDQTDYYKYMIVSDDGVLKKGVSKNDGEYMLHKDKLHDLNSYYLFAARRNLSEKLDKVIPEYSEIGLDDLSDIIADRHIYRVNEITYTINKFSQATYEDLQVEAYKYKYRTKDLTKEQISKNASKIDQYEIKEVLKRMMGGYDNSYNAYTENIILRSKVNSKVSELDQTFIDSLRFKNADALPLIVEVFNTSKDPNFINYTGNYITKGISNYDISKIGTIEEYISYVDSNYTLVGNHYTTDLFDNYAKDKNKRHKQFGEFLYLTDSNGDNWRRYISNNYSNSYSGQVYKLTFAVNSANTLVNPNLLKLRLKPEINSTPEGDYGEISYFNDPKYYDPMEKFIEAGYDTVINGKDGNYNEIVVLDAETIRLGSNKDIEMFKKWKSDKANTNLKDDTISPLSEKHQKRADIINKRCFGG